MRLEAASFVLKRQTAKCWEYLLLKKFEFEESVWEAVGFAFSRTLLKSSSTSISDHTAWPMNIPI